MSKVSLNRQSITLSVPDHIAEHIKKNKDIKLSRWFYENYEKTFMKKEKISDLKKQLEKLETNKKAPKITEEDLEWAKKFGEDLAFKKEDKWKNYCNSVRYVSFDEFQVLIEKLKKKIGK